MRALFEIRGKVLYAETDSSLPHDTVKVHSLDAFAAMLDALDNDAPQFEVHGKNGTKPLVRRARRKAAATAVVPDVPPEFCPPTPEGGWKDGNGRAIILSNFGVSREQIAAAILKRPGKLDEEQMKLLGTRFGLGNPKAKPHSTQELADLLGITADNPTTGQARVSAQVKKALRKLGLRVKSYRHFDKKV